jgi:WD40 repeat protein
MKRKMKALSGYEVEEAKKTLVVPKKDGTLMLTDGGDASSQQLGEGRLINVPPTTGSGDNVRLHSGTPRPFTAMISTLTRFAPLPLPLPQARPAASSSSSSALVSKAQAKVPTPQWHANWELSAVISGHLGWVRSIAFDPSNEWFVTGSVDRTIKVWDLAKCCAGAEGGLKLTLTGHIHSVRGLAVSSRHPYLFSAGEDKLVKCE